MISLIPDSAAMANPAKRMEESFSPGGLLASAKNYEFRPQQLRMAQRVAETFARGGHIAIEAGTGTGKSLAYLVPSVLAAKEQGRVELNRKQFRDERDVFIEQLLLKVDGVGRDDRLAPLLFGRKHRGHKVSQRLPGACPGLDRDMPA
ncbi:MAG: hypothetical protein ACKOEG_07845, partial [Chthoniobacterales bacterium]